MMKCQNQRVPSRIGVAWLGALLCLWSREAKAAITIYTNEAQFLAAVGSMPVLFNDFSNYTYFEWLAHAPQVCSNGIGYYITTLPPLHLVGYPGALSTLLTNDQMTITFTSGNVAGAGGWCFSADTNVTPTSGSVTVHLSDGTTTNLTSTAGMLAPFAGFLSDGPIITSLSLSNSSGPGHPALAHFYAVDGIPNPAIALTRTNTLLLSWYYAPTGFVLQASSKASGGIWTNLSLTPQLVGTSYRVIVPSAGSSLFFRLKK